MRLVPLGLTVAIVALSPRANAQDTLATVARAMYGEMAVIVQVRPNQVRLAVDNGRENIFLSFVGTDVRRWSDTTIRLLTRRRSKRDTTSWRSAVHEPGERAGTASLSMRVEEDGPVLTLFFADDSLVEVRGPIDSEDAQAFARVLQKASALALGPERKPATARRPAKKP
ncbi:MAG TPA: hypothetical protein VH762_02070 [Gemmatimonadaceae bacterium]|jgi:hypothetical protein